MSKTKADLEESMIRILTLDEVREAEDPRFADLAVILNHDVAEFHSSLEGKFRGEKVLRWKPNLLVSKLVDDIEFCVTQDRTKFGRQETMQGHVSLNDIWMHFVEGNIHLLELMKFYAGMGYSLDGFYEVFGQKDSYDYPSLENAKPQNEDDEDNEDQENLIDWVLKTYNGQVPKI